MPDAPAKPVQRVPAGSSIGTQPKTFATTDSFVNFAAKLGVGPGGQNLLSAGWYQFNFLTQARQRLEAMYRGSWIVGAAVDYPAQDMTRGGIEITGSWEGDEIESVNATALDLGVWQAYRDAIAWARLFGGSIAVPLIDGQDLSTPLDLDTVGKDSFKGMLVLDRWLTIPTITDLITDLGPDLGLPKFYDVLAGQGMPAMRIHHSRAQRFLGLKLPYWQSLIEQRWGASIIERIYDRIVAFDSTTTGTAQLVFKAYLRTLKIEGYRDIIAAGGPMLDGLTKQLNMIATYQANEGLTLLDAKDEFDVHTFTFAGLDDVLGAFGDQLCGALEIPRTRLFGASPGGLNSTGDGDLTNYYDGNEKKQESELRRPLTQTLDILSRSVRGQPAGEDFRYTFRSLNRLTDQEKADGAFKITSAVTGASDAGIISPKRALVELRESGRRTGVWSTITDEEIDAAEDEPAPAPVMADDPEAGTGEPGKPGASKPTLVKPEGKTAA